MKSRMFANGSPRPEISARRNATVTISVPLATRASRISSFEPNLPVPTRSREVNSRSAIFNLDGLSDIGSNLSQHRTRPTGCHPARSRGTSPLVERCSTGSLDFARDDAVFFTCTNVHPAQRLFMTGFDLRHRD